MNETLPTTADDPRLKDWYNTIELGNGLRSEGIYDLRSSVDQHGIPKSLEGKTALDVATGDGFWAFEMERRGADRVVAIDVARTGDLDWLPWIRESLGADAEGYSTLSLAHAMRGSSVECKVCNVYDLSPETVGTFDVVFCGSLLLHLQNPLMALANIRSVTNEMAIVSTVLDEEIEGAAPDQPWLGFGHTDESRPGEACTYWRFNTRALREAMEYAGFARTEPLEPVTMTPAEFRSCVVIGYPEESS